MDQHKIGSFLKELRMEKGLTQAELAEQLNTTNRSISRWETGNTMPDISILVELAEFYQVDIKEIINGERQSEKMTEDVKETVEKVAEYSRSINKKKVAKVVALMLIPIIILSVLLVVVFSSRSMEVFPDTYPAYQQVHIDETITDKLINDYILNHMPEASDSGQAKRGRPTMDDTERSSDPAKAATGKQPKPSNPEGSM